MKKIILSLILIVFNSASILFAQINYCNFEIEPYNYETNPPIDFDSSGTYNPFNTPTTSCYKTPDSIFLRTFMGDKENYIPYSDSIHALNVKKKIKIKFIVMNHNTNKDDYTELYEDTLRKYLNYGNGILSSLNEPVTFKIPTNICGNCYIKKSNIELELVDIIYKNQEDTINKTYFPDIDSILHVFFYYDATEDFTHGVAYNTNKTSLVNSNNRYPYIKINNYSSGGNYYENSRLFLHEIGHLFGLKHLYNQINQTHETCNENDPDYLKDILNTGANKWCAEENPHGFLNCDFYDSTSLCTNNIMDNRFAGYLSPMQLGIIHRSAHIGTIHKYLYPVEDPSNYPLVIKENQEWDFGIKIYQDLIIEEDVTLTIKCKLLMPPTGKIIVKKGGSLIIDNGEITSYHDNSRWSGIELEGEEDLVAFPGYQATLEMKNSAIISNALVAIRNFIYNENQTIEGGGVILVKDSKFENCIKAVELNNYGNISYYNGYGNIEEKSYCSFDNVSFILNDTNIYSGTYKFKEIFTAHNIKGGIEIKNSYFENQIPIEKREEYGKEMAINLQNSSALITNSEFNGFFNAIKSGQYYSLANRTSNILNNTFKNNTHSIILLNASNNNIKNNSIKNMIPYTYPINNAIILDGSSGIYIKNSYNTLVNCGNYIDGESASNNNYGLIIDNSGLRAFVNSNMIRNNYFENLFSGLQTQNINSNIHINCNLFKNNLWALNINPESHNGTINNLGTGCLLNETRANNRFQGNGLDILSHLNQNWNYYYWSNDSDFIPTLYGNITQILCIDSLASSNHDPNSSCDSLISCIDFNNLPNITETETIITDFNGSFERLSAENKIELENLIVNNLIRLNEYDKIIDFYENLPITSANRILIGLYFEKKDYLKMESVISNLDLSEEEKTGYLNYYNFLKTNIYTKSSIDSLLFEEKQFLINLINEELEVSLYAKDLLSYFHEEYLDLEIEKTLVSTENKYLEYSIEEDFVFNVKQVYPNPTSEYLNIEYLLENKNQLNIISKIKIYDSYGKLMYQKENKGIGSFKNTVNVKNWSPGVYTCKVGIENKKEHNKIMKFIIIH